VGQISESGAYFFLNARDGLVVDLALLFGSGYQSAGCPSGGASSFFAMCLSILIRSIPSMALKPAL